MGRFADALSKAAYPEGGRPAAARERIAPRSEVTLIEVPGRAPAGLPAAGSHSATAIRLRTNALAAAVRIVRFVSAEPSPARLEVVVGVAAAMGRDHHETVLIVAAGEPAPRLRPGAGDPPSIVEIYALHRNVWAAPQAGSDHGAVIRAALGRFDWVFIDGAPASRDRGEPGPAATGGVLVLADGADAGPRIDRGLSSLGAGTRVLGAVITTGVHASTERRQDR